MLAVPRQPPVTPVCVLHILQVLGRPEARMHVCRKLTLPGVNIRFVNSPGEADAVLNSVTGVPLAGVDCWTGKIVLLPPIPAQQRLPVRKDSDVCAAGVTC